MIKHVTIAASAIALAAPTFAQDESQSHSNIEAAAQPVTPAPSPNQIVDEAKAEEWMRIPAEDLLVMTLAPDAEGNPREVIIQLMPAPFSQGWVHNIRLLARSGWYDNISVNRVQDNYVVQWGDPNYDNPETDGETKPLPEGLKEMGEDEYVASRCGGYHLCPPIPAHLAPTKYITEDYGGRPMFHYGWPIGADPDGNNSWPIHCYGMVGVGRNYSPDTGSGAELYTVIGHAPRHLDRNIALVGRVIEGMEHLSSLPRGKGELGFYADFEKGKRTPILSVRVAGDLQASNSEAVGRKYAFDYLSTESDSFAKYAEARANRRDPFFIHPAGGADICNIPVPVRRVTGD